MQVSNHKFSPVSPQSFWHWLRWRVQGPSCHILRPSSFAHRSGSLAHAARQRLDLDSVAWSSRVVAMKSFAGNWKVQRKLRSAGMWMPHSHPEFWFLYAQAPKPNPHQSESCQPSEVLPPSSGWQLICVYGGHAHGHACILPSCSPAVLMQSSPITPRLVDPCNMPFWGRDLKTLTGRGEKGKFYGVAGARLPLNLTTLSSRRLMA